MGINSDNGLEVGMEMRRGCSGGNFQTRIMGGSNGGMPVVMVVMVMMVMSNED